MSSDVRYYLDGMRRLGGWRQYCEDKRTGHPWHLGINGWQNARQRRLETHGWHLGIYGAPSHIDSAAGWVSHMNNTDVYPAGLGTRPTKEELRRQAWACTSSSAPPTLHLPPSSPTDFPKCILRFTNVWLLFGFTSGPHLGCSDPFLMGQDRTGTH